MAERGQVSIFIILGLVIILSSSLIFYLNSMKSRETKSEVETSYETSLDIIPIKNYVESCIQMVGEEGIQLIGRQGGYFNKSLYPIRDLGQAFPYYFYEDKSLMPTKQTVQEELSKYVDNNLFNCLNNFSIFKQQGVNVKHNGVRTETLISQNKIIFLVFYPLVVTKQKTETQISEFSAQVENVRLHKIYDVIQNLILKHIRNSHSICLSCILEYADINEFDIYLDHLDNSRIQFIIQDNKTILNGEPFEYIFINKYVENPCNLNIDGDYFQIENCLTLKKEELGYNFIVYEIPDMAAKNGELFQYKVIASGIGLKYSDSTYLFEINSTTGDIRFLPREDDIGNYTILITVRDGFGSEEYKPFNLKIN